MNKKIIKIFLVAVLLFILYSNVSASSEPNGFRGWVWGQPYETVKQELIPVSTFYDTKTYRKINENLLLTDFTSTNFQSALLNIADPAKATKYTNQYLDAILYCFKNQKLVMVVMQRKINNNSTIGPLCLQFEFAFSYASTYIGSAIVWQGNVSAAMMDTLYDPSDSINTMVEVAILAEKAYFKQMIEPMLKDDDFSL